MIHQASKGYILHPPYAFNAVAVGIYLHFQKVWGQKESMEDADCIYAVVFPIGELSHRGEVRILQRRDQVYSGGGRDFRRLLMRIFTATFGSTNYGFNPQQKWIVTLRPARLGLISSGINSVGNREWMTPNRYPQKPFNDFNLSLSLTPLMAGGGGKWPNFYLTMYRKKRDLWPIPMLPARRAGFNYIRLSFFHPHPPRLPPPPP